MGTREQTVANAQGMRITQKTDTQRLAEIATLAVAQLIKFLGTSAYLWTP